MDNHVDNYFAFQDEGMSEIDPTRELWSTVLAQLGADERITPQLHGLSLIHI